VTVEVKVPTLPESVPDATLLDWRKKVGDAVERDEILVELETDKVVLEVPAPQAGVLTEIVKNTGDVAVADDVLARIDTEAKAAAGDGAAGDDGAAAEAAEGGEQVQDSAPDEASEEAPAKPAEPAQAAAAGEDLSPAARRLVEEHGLDAAAIEGTGRGGRLTKGDVLAHLERAGSGAGEEAREAQAKPAPAPRTEPKSEAGAKPKADGGQAPAAKPAAPSPRAAGSREGRREPMSRLRQRVAERLVSAQHTAAILTTFNEVNMQPVMELRNRHKDRFEKVHGVRLGFMSFFAKAAVAALERFPAVNAYNEDKEIVYHDYCDIGVAVGSPRGLVVPILRNVEDMSFAGIERAIADFGERAKSGQLTVDEMTGGTFTISNGGVFGSLLSTPILNPPQSAILGMHKTEQRPVVEDGEVVVRPMMYLALSYDHRIVDGREAVLFLVTIKEALEDPGRLLLGV